MHSRGAVSEILADWGRIRRSPRSPTIGPNYSFRVSEIGAGGIYETGLQNAQGFIQPWPVSASDGSCRAH
jgi:hypothetical protein